MPQKAPKKLTPAMQQFERFKKQHPDCVLFFRMGDFYEMFYQDAELAHKVLGVTLTQRTEGVPMAGVPYHAVDGYLRRMIQAGHRVAVCEQVEDPAEAKGVVKRDVTRVVTPGTITEEHLLEEGTENPLAAIAFLDAKKGSGSVSEGLIVAAAWAEVSTGAFHLGVFEHGEAADELARIGPREVLYVETGDRKPPGRVLELAEQLNSPVLSGRPAWQFRHGEAARTLCEQFRVAQLNGFGLDEDHPALGPAAAIVHYLLETQHTADEDGAPRLTHLRPPTVFDRGDHLVIDRTTLRSLEVERTMRAGSTDGSLLGILQRARTAMGKRALRHWLCYPLRDRQRIEARQRVVRAMLEDAKFLDALTERFDAIQDVQRIGSRLGVQRPTPRDLVALGRSVGEAAKMLELLADRPAVATQHERLAAVVPQLNELAGLITKACIDDPPAHLREGGLIRDGYDAELDECRALQADSDAWLARYQKQLVEQTSIPSLKIGYNKVFGFYIELTAAHRDKAPDSWTRKQTLKNAERFITPELKDYENKVLSAEQRAVAREQKLFGELCEEASARAASLHEFAEVTAELDVLGSFARQAARRRYVQPTLVDGPGLHVKAGRHPVLEQMLGEQFVPNDVHLGPGEGNTSATLALITGPNMAGKSTYIRQAALIALLAHTGSFVPAEQATVGLCDRIFTRVGASDELHAGQSTFMVEMVETANICHHATDRSLVILDEIGRGTSTLDGLSLAWAIAEHLAQRKVRALFATHYHELTELAAQFEQVTNLNVTVREWQDEIAFLHRIVPGATDRSYGIHVAKIAGLPRQVVERANELLKQLEVSHHAPRQPADPAPKPDAQMSLFTEYVEHPAVERLREADLNALSPMQAFDLLREVKRELEGQRSQEDGG